MRFHMSKEVSKGLLNVYKSVLNELILQPRRQLIVERFYHKGFKARLSLLELDRIHELVPLVWIKPFAGTIDKIEIISTSKLMNTFHLRVDLINKLFCL